MGERTKDLGATSLQRAIHSTKILGCWDSYPVAAVLPQENNSEQSGEFLSASQAWHSSRTMPRAHTAPLQYLAHGSPIHCPQQSHPGQAPTADPPTEPSYTMGSLTNDSSYPPTPPTRSHSAAPLQMHFPPAHTQLSDSRTVGQHSHVS